MQLHKLRTLRNLDLPSMLHYALNSSKNSSNNNNKRYMCEYLPLRTIYPHLRVPGGSWKVIWERPRLSAAKNPQLFLFSAAGVFRALSSGCIFGQKADRPTQAEIMYSGGRSPTVARRSRSLKDLRKHFLESFLSLLSLPSRHGKMLHLQQIFL